VVTGSAGGIGSTVAQGLAARGAFIALVDKDKNKVFHIESEINSKGYRTKAFQADVGNSEEVEATVKAIEESMGTDERSMCGFPGGIQIRNTFKEISKP
jgi:NAD(P)-dependent dehydrogenase (short-subunit alcohol dehydrogenase family)